MGRKKKKKSPCQNDGGVGFSAALSGHDLVSAPSRVVGDFKLHTFFIGREFVF